MENKVNERIGELIKALKISNNAFSKSIGKSASAVNFMLDGRSKPSYDVLEAICEVYPDVNPSWLLVGEGTMWRSEVSTTNPASAGPDQYLQSYLEKLEEQFKRIVNQLETKDMQIASLTEMLKMTLGKSEGVIKSQTTPVRALLSESGIVLEMYPEAGALEA